MKRINWITAIFLIATPIGALLWGALHVRSEGLDPRALAFFAVYFVATSMSITAGYHRLFAHRAYEARPLVRAVYLLLGAATFQHSALSWSSDHRLHHRNIDRDGDPYNVRKGFWWAHMGWLLFTDHKKSRFENVPDLQSDWMVVAQDRFYLPIAIAMGFGLPLAIGAALGNPWGFLLWGGLIRVVLGHHTTFLVNSLAHTLGRRPYEPAFSARDSFVTAVLTFGEGYHNFHHRFASDYRNGVRRFHWDPTKWLIRGLEGIGLASNLRRVPRERIMAARLRSDRARVLARVQESSHDAVAAVQRQAAEVSAMVERAVARLGELERELLRLRSLRGTTEHRRAVRVDLKVARREFRDAWRRWKEELARFVEARDGAGTATA